MITIGQTCVFLKEYVNIHQIGNHFVDGYQLNFSPTEQETKPLFFSFFFLQPASPW